MAESLDGIQARENERFWKASGEVDDHRPLVAFLYVLMRDHMTSGQVESLWEGRTLQAARTEYTNGWLAHHAQDLADRLVPAATEGQAAAEVCGRCGTVLALGVCPSSRCD